MNLVFGSFAFYDIKLQGESVYIWSRKQHYYYG